MANQLLDQVHNITEGQIDFKGQQLAELGTITLLATASVNTIYYTRI